MFGTTVTAAQTQELTTPALIGVIALYLLLAVLAWTLSRSIARRLLALRWLIPSKRRMSAERRQTLEGLIGSMISLLALVVVMVAILAHFVRAETLVWIIGLFSAAFGLGARALVADVLAGGRFIFRNTFAIGEKVALVAAGVTVEGIIEEVNVTNTIVRAPSGELCVVPNGDISVIRNYNRAPFSAAKIRFSVKSEQLARTLALLEPLGHEAVTLLPELAEPWQVISTSEAMGQKTELTVTAHTSFGRAAGLKLRMFEMIYRRLRDAEIELLD